MRWLMFLMISSVGFVYPQGEGLPRAIFNVKTDNLPFKSVVWLNDQQVCAGGFTCNLVVFQGDEMVGNKLIG